MTFDDLPTTIPLFPLEGALLLPGGILPLNIFEAKYVQMIDDAMRTHRMIGMIQPDMTMREKGKKDAILKIGCAGRITQFSETDDDRYMIMLSGLSRFEVEAEPTSMLPYRQAKVNWTPYQDDIVDDCDTIEIDRDAFLPLLEAYFKIHDIRCEWDIIKQSPCETLITTLPMICPFEPLEKQALLEAKTMEDRYETLTTLLTIALNDNGEKASQTLKH